MLFAGASQAQAPSQPPLPFYDWGACPFEGCTYRQWKAVRPVSVWAGRNHHRAAFTIKAGEWVTGLTGVVITAHSGISKVLVPMTLGEQTTVSVSPGDLLYTLHYLGEGYDLFWFKGRTYADQISGEPGPDPPSPGATIQILSRPQYDWWVKVRNGKGQVGWTDQTGGFTNMDQFARCPIPPRLLRKNRIHLASLTPSFCNLIGKSAATFLVRPSTPQPEREKAKPWSWSGSFHGEPKVIWPKSAIPAG